MKGKRSKRYRKSMQQYGMSFGFREPYQVLVDAQMIQNTESFKMDLVRGLERTLSGKVKPMITQCSIRHLYNLTEIPKSLKETLIHSGKSMERRRCNHHTLENPLSTLECLSSVIDPKDSLTNKHRYVVASQDEEVRRHCREIEGVPLIYVKRSVMVMEPMATSSVAVRESQEKEKFRSGLKGRVASLGKRKRDEGAEDAAGDHEDGREQTDAGAEGEKEVKKKKRGPKGPNPLSVKKSKKTREPKSDNQPLDMGVDVKMRGVGGRLNGDGHVNGDEGVDIHIDGLETTSNRPSRKRKRRRRPDEHLEA